MLGGDQALATCKRLLNTWKKHYDSDLRRLVLASSNVTRELKVQKERSDIPQSLKGSSLVCMTVKQHLVFFFVLTLRYLTNLNDITSLSSHSNR